MHRTLRWILPLLLLVPTLARANGAFPDSMRVLLPEADPQRFYVAANFGVVRSDDGGASWRFVCESRVTSSLGVTIYDLGPTGTLYAASPAGVARSTDGGCTWRMATGSVSHRRVWDVFPDQSDANVVWALGSVDGGQSAIYRSNNGGASFGPALVTSQDQLNGIESARSDGQIVWATAFRTGDSTTPSLSYLLRSTNGGTSWQRVDAPQLENTLTRIAAVDPTDPQIAFLRVTPLGTRADQLVIARDGGATLEVALTLGTVMSGFVRRSDGTLVVGSSLPEGKLWTRAPQATGFTQTAGPLVRCLGERDGRLYACGDNFADHFSLGEAQPDGTFLPRMTFEQLQGPLQCLVAEHACANEWNQLRAQLGLPPVEEEEPDAGPDAPDASVAAPDAGMPVSPADPQGCGCASTQAGASLAVGAWLLRSRRIRSGASIARERRDP